MNAAIRAAVEDAGLSPGPCRTSSIARSTRTSASAADVTTLATIPRRPARRPPISSRAWPASSPDCPSRPGCSTPSAQGRLRVEYGTLDGSLVSSGEVLATVRGPVRDLLTAERTALNLLGHLSGIATLTQRWVEAVRGTGAADPRHPQDDARSARAREVRRALRRRREPPDVAVGRRARQGQPRRGGRGGRRAFALVRAAYPDIAARGRGRHDRAGPRGHRRGRRPGPARQHDAGHDGRGSRLRPRARRSARGIRRPDARPGPRRRRDRRRLPLGRRADALRARCSTSASTFTKQEGTDVLLAIDIGNTNTVLGVFDGDRLDASWRDQDRCAQHRRRVGAHVPWLARRSRGRLRSRPARPSRPRCANCGRCWRATTRASRPSSSSRVYGPA